jgi:peptidoglycan/xylan/chitin deacetylase (PgdA/CDA1 family)
MDDGFRVLREACSDPARRLYGPMRRRSMARHHRRRRVLAALVLVALAAIAGKTILIRSPTAPHGHHALGPGSAYLRRVATLAGTGPTSLAGMLAAAESHAIDRTMAATPYVRIAGRQHREIALTFDDGPGPYTPQIIEILRRAKTRATFFEVGVLERYFHVSTTAIVAAGNVIGDHTEAHAPMSRLSAFDQREQILEDATVIGQYGAGFPRLFRPPYGQFNATTLRLLRRYRMLMVLWTVDTNDYRRPGVKAIVHSAVAGARPGAIILMHDAGGNRAETVAALPKVIAALRERRYTLVTVPRLLLDNPPPAHQNLRALAPGGG